MRLSKESIILSGLCLADLISTVVLIKGYGASEANAVLRFYLAYGLSAFVAAKCFLSIPALLVAEWYRPRNPLLVTGLLRLVIGLYLGGYSASAYQLNCAPGAAPVP